MSSRPQYLLNPGHGPDCHVLLNTRMDIYSTDHSLSVCLLNLNNNLKNVVIVSELYIQAYKRLVFPHVEHLEADENIFTVGLHSF